LLQYIASLQARQIDESATSSEENPNDIDREIEALRKKIASTRAKRMRKLNNRSIIAKEILSSRVAVDSLETRLNQLANVHSLMIDQISSLDEETTRSMAMLRRYMNMNAVNDAFYIWYAGPYGSINTFRLGNLPSKPIDFSEINAALGQAALVINIITAKAGIELKAYTIVPFGSFPKIITKDDRRTQYPLFIDNSTFNLFPKRNFNLALNGFLCCIQEISEHISSYDPTLTVPYKIVLTSTDSKIGDLSCVYGSADDEIWTRALKFMLSDIKWIIAWYTKHCNNYVPIKDV
jgi:beclin 1